MTLLQLLTHLIQSIVLAWFAVLVFATVSLSRHLWRTYRSRIKLALASWWRRRVLLLGRGVNRYREETTLRAYLRRLNGTRTYSETKKLI